MAVHKTEILLTVKHTPTDVDHITIISDMKIRKPSQDTYLSDDKSCRDEPDLSDEKTSAELVETGVKKICILRNG